MLCSRPFVQGMAEFGCGQCMPCRINRRKLWTARLMLEAQRHEFSFFVTLTYKEMPPNGSLSPRDLQLFLKSLRKLLAPVRIRFYAVGEYGERRGRPHYHLALFGFPYGDQEKACQAISSVWKVGAVHVGSLTTASAGYIAGYVTKGMTKDGDARLNGREPEFSRMSLRPGIGADAVDIMATEIVKGVDVSTGELYGRVDGDVPSQFVYDGKRFPLGRYLRRRLRVRVGADVAEPVACGELRSIKRFVDLSAHGLSAWKIREGRRLQSEHRAKGIFQRSADKKGVWL